MSTSDPLDTSASPIPYVLPFVVFMVASLFEPRFAAEPQVEPLSRDEITAPLTAEESRANAQYIRDQERVTTLRYVVVYSIKCLVTLGALVWFWRSWYPAFPFSITVASLLVGAVGVVVWIGLCHLDIEETVVGWFATSHETAGVRSQFNPFQRIPETGLRTAFLATRFFGLAVMVPIIEELFLRGFLMRYFADTQWWQVSLARMNIKALIVAPIYGVLTHPTEALAAIAWFSLVTWLVNRTGRFWDAVVAHAVTNLLLGVYVCLWSQWQLW